LNLSNKDRNFGCKDLQIVMLNTIIIGEDLDGIPLSQTVPSRPTKADILESVAGIKIKYPA